MIEETKKEFIAGLSDDLNISVALSALFGLIRKANTLITEGKVYRADAQKLTAFTWSLNTVLAVLPEKAEATLPPELAQKIEDREKARTRKDFKLADRIREELLQQGILLEDTKDGVRWKRIR